MVPIAALTALGLAESVAHAESVMAKYSVEQSAHGTLQLDEYRKVVEHCRAFQKHKSAFRRYDTDCNGSIDRRELFDALSEMGLLASQEEARQVFQRFDADSNGSLTLDEFIQLATALSSFKRGERNA